MLAFKFWLFQLFFYEFVFCDWVEIPLSGKKSYLVTPYTPYIYSPSLVFTSTTTEHYETVQPLHKPKINLKSEPKKSITKMPDSVLRKTTTEIPWIKSSTRKSIIKQAHVTRINSSTVNYTKRPNLRAATHEKLRFPITTPTPPMVSDIPILKNKNFQLDNEEEEEEEFEDENEYEQVYDDDEDNYPDDNDDVNDDDDMALDPSDIGEDNMDESTHPDDEYYYDDEYEDEPPVEEPKRNANSQENANTNGFSYANIVPYLQNIQSTLIRTSHTDSVSNKLSFLTDIKDRLLYAIQSRISSIWEPRSKRQTRATRGDMWDSWEKGGSEHGMEFPSNEGALLTLGFLTFAVFLIKCILKLIHAIKGKHHSHDKGTTIIIQNGTAAPSTRYRFKREFDDLEVANFMANLESYNPH